MSVNYRDPETGELSPLSAAYSKLAIIDVDYLPQTDIQDAIYCVASDNYVKADVVLSNSDMTVNTAALEALGMSTSIDGSEYTYTPNQYVGIRYLVNSDTYNVSKIKIDSHDWSIIIYDVDNNPLMQAFIDSGMTLTFYYAQTWSEVGITLSHTNMTTNNRSLTSVGFAVKEGVGIYTYKPSTSRFKYNGEYVDQIVITASDGNMVITSPEGTELYNDIIVDGIYDFLYATAVTYWIGSAPRQTYERLAKATDMDVNALTTSQVEDLLNLLV